MVDFTQSLLGKLLDEHVELFMININLTFSLSFFKEQGSKGMHKFLQYMTSLDRIPPLGLEHSIDLEFYEGENFFAETCTLVLRVPTIYDEFDDFKKKFLEACDNSLGFGCI